MAFTISSTTESAPRGSLAHRAAEYLNAIAVAQLSLSYSAAGVATGTTTSKVKTVNTVTYTVNGIYQTAKTATDDFWTLSGAVVPASSFQKYALLIDTAGEA